jgi:hypothetical protein
MIDAEVSRLRKLRNVALRARALAKILDSDSTAQLEGQSVFTRTAVACWTIARIASGRLRAHPYLSYQQGRGALRGMADGLSASLIALNARRQNRRVGICAQQLQIVAREVDDVRALTWSPELSDALGRMQVQMRRLAHELDLDALKEGGDMLPRAKILACAETSDVMEEMTADNSWPYLAI